MKPDRNLLRLFPNQNWRSFSKAKRTTSSQLWKNHLQILAWNRGNLQCLSFYQPKIRKSAQFYLNTAMKRITTSLRSSERGGSKRRKVNSRKDCKGNCLGSRCDRLSISLDVCNNRMRITFLSMNQSLFGRLSNLQIALGILWSGCFDVLPRW